MNSAQQQENSDFLTLYRVIDEAAMSRKDRQEASEALERLNSAAMLYDVHKEDE